MVVVMVMTVMTKVDDGRRPPVGASFTVAFYRQLSKC
jgi:hypothetical protein